MAMSNVKRKASHRLLAALLSIAMVFSMIPFSMVAYAATTSHPDAVTVTVVDDVTGEPIEDAKVTYVIYDNDLGSDVMGNDDVPTDANGEVVVFDGSEPGNIMVSSITVTHDDYETYTNDAYNQVITSLQDNFTIQMTCTKIKDVQIFGKTLTYNGSEQELVSVTEVAGDTVEYYLNGATEPVSEVPKATDAGTYSVRVVVARTGYTTLDKTVQTVIKPADIEDISIEEKNITYNETAQEIVTLNGSFKQGDVVTWTVNTVDNVTKDIPTATAVGQYTIVLTVDRGSNYNKLITAPVTTNLIEGNLDLEGLVVKGLEGIYTVENDIPVAQPAVTVENKGNYDLKYQLDDGDLTVNDSAWVDEIPTVTDAGSYIIWVKAVKDSYNDADVIVDPAASAVAPYNVFIAKAEQSFAFNEFTGTSGTDQISGKVPYGKEYNFGAIDTAALAGGSITYRIETDEEGIASIDANTGLLTVDYPGSIKVIANLSGNSNYKECVIEYTLDVSGVVSSQGQYISFANNKIDYVIGTSNNVANQTAVKANNRIKGSISYRLDRTPGVSINTNTGVVTVTDYNVLAEAIRATADGSLKLTVEATKAKFGRYGVDTASYIISITFEDTPANSYKLPTVDGTNGWYISNVDVVPVEGYKIAKAAADVFADSVTFSDQGTATRYVYLKNTTTGGITDKIAVNIKIDTGNPGNLNIEFSELNLIQKIGQSLGFYNPTITITFTAEDENSGIDHFDWTYTPETGTPVTEEIAVTVDGNRATATLTLPASQAEQMHGKISFTATDKASNEIGKDDDYVFIVDTIAPELSIKYQGEAPYEAQEGSYNGAHFFNSDVAVELTITETNFYAEDVVVKVSKDGGVATSVTPSWNGKVGTFTLDGDGDYIVYVTYTDKANNQMSDYESEVITVDKTAPIVKIDYIHNGDIQKTVFTVTEHNFRASDVVITGTMKDITDVDVSFTAAQLTAILQAATWTPAGTDTYSYEYDQYVNGIYNLKMDYQDITGWDAVQFVSDEFIIDNGAPSEPTVDYITTPWNTFLSVITFGYYNPSVTVRFTSYDTSSGVESFTWGYTKENGASTINHPESLADATIPAVQDQIDKSKFTAEITLTANQVAQYRGYLSVLATDAFQNKSVKKVDNGNIIVVDTIAPEISVEYTEADRVIGQDYFYNNDVDVKFTVTEANFYAEDVEVTVTKNGEAFNYGSVSWGTRNAEDKVIGTFTLPAPADHSGDGHYVITVEYPDRSNNEMVKYVSDTHTIDTTLPVINVEYLNKTVENKLTDRDGNERKYFADTQTAVITINEHNFISDEVDFTIIAKDVTGAVLDAATLSSKSAWTVDSTGDIHIITITYPGDANYTFDVAYTDKATNAAEDYATDYFTVDKTDPTNLTVNYSTSVLDTVLESVTFGFYNAKMKVTLTAEDTTSEVHSFLYSYLNAAGVSNVNAELINEAIQAADIKYSENRKTATVTFEIPKMVLGSDNQFNGTVEFTATDRAGNESDAHKETKRIVVDNIAPTAQVSYNEATNVVGDISYYNGNINATVTINEANFYANDVQVTVSKDGGAATAVTPTWNDNSVDVHVGTFTLTEDGDYFVTINYTDKSSNKMTTYTSKQMTIDAKMEVPTYTINSVAKTEVGGAYKGEATIGFNFADQNFDTKTIKLTRTRFDKVDDVTDTFIKVNDNDKGGSGSFTIPSEVGNDGIYVLTIGMTDKAKHTSESEIKFTINRYGSVYEYSDELVALIKDGGQYITSVEDDLVITEYNADRILEGSLKILITRDGETVDVDFTSNPENINAQVGIGESGWYQYVYTIKSSNFEKDGVYKISLTSKYAADDSAENESTSVPDNSIDEQGKEILDTMNFTVDSVAPEIRNIVNLDKKIADVDKIVDGKLNVKYTIVDVGGLKTIEVIVNGETIKTLTSEEIGDNLYNFNGDFDLTEQTGTTAHKVRIKVTDLAGNVTDTDSEDFLKAHSEDNKDSTYVFFNEVTVSRNAFVRWYANKGLFWGSIAGVIVLAGGICTLVTYRRKKKESASK